MGENTTTRLDSWLIRIKDGDDTAFDELLRHFEARLNALASKMLKRFPEVGSKEQTGDVLQEVSLRLLASLRASIASGKVPVGTKSFHAADFVRFAAHRIRLELLNLAKWHSRRRADELPSHEGLAGHAPGTWDPAQLAEWAEFHEKAAVLPEKAREVFDLLYYGDLKQEDAAKLLRVDVRTVKSRWQEARLRLSDALGGRLPGL
jgi:RNA polymerase sigma factor (sigma-70 family)